MHGFINPQGLACLLFEAQKGRCFHCGAPMIFHRKGAPTDKGMLATREHIYPNGDARRNCQNGWVLAHARCNHVRGSGPLPDHKIAKAIEVYASIGLTAFAPKDVPGQPSPYPRKENIHRARAADKALERYRARIGIWKDEMFSI